MRVSRIYTDQSLESGRSVTLEGASAAYVARVLRLRPGTQLTIFNGQGGEFAAVLLATRKEAVTCELREFNAIERESLVSIVLLQGIARGDRMDAIVQKSTELGVARLVPVATERSVVKVSADANERKQAHWRGIAIAACEQCGRNRIPQIDTPLTPECAFDAAVHVEQKILLDPQGSAGVADAFAAIGPSASVALLIGPEGGLTAEEGELAARGGFGSFRLGTRVLRTETASLAALAVLHAIHGDFRRSES